jgi:hypothetical protein
MRKTPLRDGDRLRLQVGVVMNLGLLAVEAGSRPGSDVGGEPSPDKPKRHQNLLFFFFSNLLCGTLSNALAKASSYWLIHILVLRTTRLQTDR